MFTRIFSTLAPAKHENEATIVAKIRMFLGFRECLARRNPPGIIRIKHALVAEIRMFSGFRECFCTKKSVGYHWIEATIVAEIHITHLGGFMIKLKNYLPSLLLPSWLHLLLQAVAAKKTNPQ